MSYRDRSLHIVTWAQKFLFRSDQLDTPVRNLSGGEKARILIADLMRQPADILLLDEPTNDLDIPSLQVLEESLLEFSGSVVLVTHDRFLLNRVCDVVLGFDGKGIVTAFADHEQWYAQGYQLMRAAADNYGWKLNYGGIALMWRGGCIIRSAFLGKIKEAFDSNSELDNLLLDPFFKAAVGRAQAAWRRVIQNAVELGIPMPAITAALAYYDGYRSERLPANLLQAQRDYFGAHTYERIDQPRGQVFHTNWTGRGGSTSASTYVV